MRGGRHARELGEHFEGKNIMLFDSAHGEVKVC